jgi:hypothetical protein
MANTIKIKNSGISNNAPTSLEFGELGLNYADGKIFFKNLSNTIVEFSTPPNLVIQGTAPANTSVLWADTSVTGVGVVPVGGTTGQVLSKGSNTSYDAVWANVVTSSDLSLKANIASPTFTGTVTIPAGASISGFAPLANAALTGVPTAPTANAATNTTQIATTAFVRTEVANLVASAPAALDTLDELAAALGDDANFATTTATAIGLKAPLASPTFTGTVTIPAGASISGFAPLASPSLTGTPTAPTATAGTNSTQIATMASRPWNTAWGFITQGTLAAGTGYITAEQDLISVTFTAVANRRYLYTATGLVVSDGVGPMSTNLTDTSNNRIREYFTYFSSGAGSNYQTGIIDYVETFASSGSVTRKIRNQSTSMGVYYYGAAVRDSIAWKLRVEDIGPA